MIGLRRKVEYFRRYRHILSVLFKYGFGHVVEKLNVEYYIESGKKILKIKSKEGKEQKLKGAERLKLAFEELGPTFIKFGQILSTRPDLIPMDYIEQLKELQDKIEPIEFGEIEEILNLNYGEDYKKVFKKVEKEVLGSASIGQVHKALLNDGTEVVIKVKKPDTDHIVELDISILYNIAVIIEKKIPELAYYNPVKLVNEFSKSIKKEMDFTLEGKNNDIIRMNFKKFKNFKVPKIYWDYTNEDILVMEFVKGKKLYDVLDGNLENGEFLAKLGANIFLKQILEDGFFHADPHPGNIFLVGKDTIVFIDYGMVGTLDEEAQENMAEILEGIVLKDIVKILNAFKNFDTLPDDLNERALKSEMRELLEKYYNTSLKNINIGKLIYEMSNIVIKYKIYVPADFFLMGKTLMTIDGIGRALYPDFDMIEVAKPFVKKLLIRKLSPERVGKKMLKSIKNYDNFFEGFPINMGVLFEKLKKDKIGIEIKSKDVKEFNATIDKTINKLSTSIIIAAIIIGSSMLIQSRTGFSIHGYSILGISGFVIAGFFGMVLVIDTFKS
ncbi:ABC1 kinase family protein [Haliovirga abyssi]|uniref:Ubiquinone biosynthesis protein UbiB n=1 Tax=Haliovirga abyssi TaxID=2996794 RepID=A0AAU9DGN2_9FUSO|nr:AarF/UbiB family protein [Haliovirga abyssi]BDU50602.1 ubiquinone biosynthesis protein UbiB [Haliovirga abyssi]